MPVFIITLLWRPERFSILLHGLNLHVDKVFCGTSHKKIFNCMCRAQSFFVFRVFLSNNGGQLLSLPRVLQSAKLYVYGIYCGMAFGRTTPHVVVSCTPSCARLFASSFCCISSLHFCTVSKILPSKPCTLIRRGKGCFIIQSLLIS